MRIRRMEAKHVAAALAAVLLAACGSDALVGGDCLPGFAPCGNACCVEPDAGGAIPATGTLPSGGNPRAGGGDDAGLPSSGDDGSTAGDDGSTAGDDAASNGGDDDASTAGDDGSSANGDAGASGDASLDDGSSSSGDDAGATNGGDASSTIGDDASANASDASADASSTDAAARDAATPPDASQPDADVDAAPLCSDGLTWCTDQCVSLDDDPDNCGACGHQCASYVCRAGMCQGQTTGDIVYLAHDYQNTQPATSQGRELMNAVMLSSHQPVRVLVFDRWADASASTRVDGVIAAIPTTIGRSVTIAHTNRDDLVPTSLGSGAVDVLVVLDQSGAPTGALSTMGAAWASALGPFTHGGGELVVLDGAAGSVQEMPAFATATGLLTVSGHTRMASGSHVDVVAPSDAVGVGVVSPYATRVDGAHFATEPASARLVYVATDPTSQEPVVVHKVAP